MGIRIYPKTASGAIYPVAASTRIYYEAVDDDYRINPGFSSYPKLGARYYPFAGFFVDLPSGVTIGSASYQVTGSSSWTEITTSGYTDLETAIKFKSFEASAFSGSLGYSLRITYSDSVVRTGLVDTPVKLILPKGKIVSAGTFSKIFTQAKYGESGTTYVSSVQFVVSAYNSAGLSGALSGTYASVSSGTASTMVKSDLPYRVLVSGKHTSTAITNTLVDALNNFYGLGVRIGDTVKLVSGGSTMTITGIGSASGTYDALSGTGLTFASGDAYQVLESVNMDILQSTYQLYLMSTGLYKCTLYVTDSSSQEYSDEIWVRVRN